VEPDAAFDLSPEYLPEKLLLSSADKSLAGKANAKHPSTATRMICFIVFPHAASDHSAEAKLKFRDRLSG
jgi:hypothetical protein